MATILVVDDQSVNRQMLATLLGYDGHRILEAADGVDALDVVRREHPALVVSDIVMPTMDGYEFVRQLRRDSRIAHTPVMFYTANYFEREARGLATQCGVHHVLTKPAEPELILATVRSALTSTLQPIGTGGESGVEAGAFDREHVRLMTDKLSAKVSELEATRQRLDALIAIGQQLNQYHDAASLLRRFCQAGREVIAARIAVVGMLAEDGETFTEITVAGATGEQLPPDLQAPRALDATPLGVPVRGRSATRIDTPGLALSTAGERYGHELPSLVGAPLYAGGRVFGCIAFAGKLGADRFTDEDEGMAVSLAAQFAVAHENVRRLETVEKENVELEHRIAVRTAELTRSNEELEQFAYVASHDLQEPLRMVASFAQLIERRYKNRLDADADEFIGYVVDGAERMKALIVDLLAYSRVNSRGAPPATVPADRALREALSNLGRAIEEQHADVTVGAMPVVFADESQLVQLFQNLIGNAIKFRGAEPPTVHVEAVHRGGEWTFSVRDNGIGIDQQFADRIFVMFQRLHSRAAFPGTGIGLAICKRIVTRLGGRIWVESQPGAGSTFWFTLPAAAGEV